MTERAAGLLEYSLCCYGDGSEMSGLSLEEISRDRLLLLAMMLSRAISVPLFKNSLEFFAGAKALVHSVALLRLL